MSETKHVMHDGHRWNVTKSYSDSDGNWLYLYRGMPTKSGYKVRRLMARASECQPDTHEPKRRIRADGITLVFNVARGLVTIRQGRHRGHELTLPGLYNAVARQAAANLQRERAFKRRTKGRK